jgi:hypothetical protein
VSYSPCAPQLNGWISIQVTQIAIFAMISAIVCAISVWWDARGKGHNCFRNVSLSLLLGQPCR